MTTSPGAVPKASLYYYKDSIWSSVALLTLEEKGYGPDEVDLKEVDLGRGENFDPTYLRINANATVPTLVVPLSTTLEPEVESRYKAIKDTKSIVEFLDKSRSPQSRTHTTSTAPAPTLAPATIAFSSASNGVIDLLHSLPADPNALFFLNARNDEELKQVTPILRPLLHAKTDAITELIRQNEGSDIKVSEKTVKFWELRRAASAMMLDVIDEGDKSVGELDDTGKHSRQEYFTAATNGWTALQEVLTTLSKEIIGPFVLGDQLSLADLHLAAWLTHIAWLSGASASDDGNAAVAAIEAHIGNNFALPKDFSVAEARRRAGLPATTVDPNERQARLAAFWDAIKERPSWKKVYAEGLH
ncbi:hypothetical protein BDW22DRAFT_1350836 [Trametopsis cervina]|nr:hypothetical protein BDW22DRAFT_1350836 [Trametopsis cervina]